MKKRIALIAKGIETRDILMEQLRQYFEPYCEVFAYLVDEGINHLPPVDTVLITSSAADIHQVARQVVPEHVPMRLINRLFEPRRLKLLMQIPEGTEVLVVNNLPVTCQEVIQTLYEANMTHLHYVPYYPGGTLPHRDYRYAITLGEPDVRPPFPVEWINVGIRKIHIHDLIDLGRQLGVPIEREKQYVSQYLSEIHQLGKQLGNSVVAMRNLHTHLESILEAVQEPIFACDSKGNITFMNKLAAQLFDCPAEGNVTRSIYELPNQELITPLIMAVEDEDETLITMKEQQFVVNCIRMKHQHEELGTVCILKNVTEIQFLERRLRKVVSDVGHVASYSFDHIIGKAPSLLRVIEQAKKMARNNRSILLTGESGTGKELFAHAIHLESQRKQGPFVAINCASFPENLLESEIFGYEEGAFTGARKGGKPGVFEQADGGTIFLDEIGDISPAIQVRLLRVLQERQLVRVGGTKVLSIDVRIIAATNRNLEEAVREGKFREDLYYRLNVLPIELPPLRERKEDIPLLLEHHLSKLHEKRTWDRKVLEVLERYHWPGNIRELINVVEYAVTVSDGKKITLLDIPPKIRKAVFRQDTDWPPNTEELAILQCLYQYHLLGKAVGRYELVKSPELMRLGITEQKLRTRLKNLLAKGLVEIGKTKQGTMISEKGLQVLAQEQTEQIRLLT